LRRRIYRLESLLLHPNGENLSDDLIGVLAESITRVAERVIDRRGCMTDRGTLG
jgi:hypothetical protein